MPETKMASPAVIGPKSRTRKPPAARFVFLEHPNGTSTGASRKQARSYAAKQGHARIRHEQVARYQESKRLEAIQPRPLRSEALAVVSLPPPNPRSLLSAAPTDPFASMAWPVSMLEYYLIDHYLQVVVPAGGFCTAAHPTTGAYLHGAKTQWIPLALTDPGMLSGILVSSCRSLHALHGKGPYLEKALNYKMICMESIRNDISGKGSTPGDASIGKAILLAGDEVCIGNVVAGKRHVEAVQQLVELRGGLATVDESSFLGGLINIFFNDTSTDLTALNVASNYSHLKEEEVIEL